MFNNIVYTIEGRENHLHMQHCKSNENCVIETSTTKINQMWDIKFEHNTKVPSIVLVGTKQNQWFPTFFYMKCKYNINPCNIHFCLTKSQPQLYPFKIKSICNHIHT